MYHAKTSEWQGLVNEYEYDLMAKSDVISPKMPTRSNPTDQSLSAPALSMAVLQNLNPCWTNQRPPAF